MRVGRKERRERGRKERGRGDGKEKKGWRKGKKRELGRND